jgi:hypothetical protein
MTVNNLTPLELVTHLFSCLQIADNQIDWEEKEVWADTLSALFPDHTPNRAQEILQRAYQTILPMDNFGRKNHLIAICNKLKDHYSNEQLQNELAPKITELIDADGMVLTAEVDSAAIVAKELGITIDISEN